MLPLKIDSQLRLEPLHRDHAEALYQLATENKQYLSEWLSWPPLMESIDFIERFIEKTTKRMEQGLELAFVILKDQDMVGRIGFSQIDQTNKTGEIGYWLAENRQGHGIIRKSAKLLLDYGFEELKLERIEIRCAVQNTKSQSIPESLGFRLEKILEQAELLHGSLVDHKVYVIEKQEN